MSYLLIKKRRPPTVKRCLSCPSHKPSLVYLYFTGSSMKRPWTKVNVLQQIFMKRRRPHIFWPTYSIYLSKCHLQLQDWDMFSLCAMTIPYWELPLHRCVYSQIGCSLFVEHFHLMSTALTFAFTFKSDISCSLLFSLKCHLPHFFKSFVTA